jgi:hypothetical protein
VEYRYSSTLSLTSALDWGRWPTPRPGRFTSGKDPVSIVYEAGWAPGPVWTGAENLAPTGIRSPDRPARSKSLLRLSCPDPRQSQLAFHTFKITNTNTAVHQHVRRTCADTEDHGYFPTRSTGGEAGYT